MEQQGLPGFFHVVARYGYNETVVQDAAFVQASRLLQMSKGGPAACPGLAWFRWPWRRLNLQQLPAPGIVQGS